MGGAMGWKPADIRSATFPEFIYCFRGWQRSQGIDPDKGAKKQFTKLDLIELEKKLEKRRGD